MPASAHSVPCPLRRVFIDSAQPPTAHAARGPPGDRASASAANTTAKCASIGSRWWWKIGPASRSLSLIRNDFSTCHRSW
ncbi:MAG: hypothetical protein QOD96_5683 [Pseudonocardiales bacterium]|nr:hypothetical protein [Pseudonocardiales bacterium]